MKEKRKLITKISDLAPDDRNANRGTERGNGLIEKSLRSYGAGRSILADKHGKIIAGNKTLEGCASIGLDKIRVIETDGTELVVVQRTDLDMDKDKAAKELAIVDNRAGQVSLEWDGEELTKTASEFEIDLTQLGFADGEISHLLEADKTSEVDDSCDSRSGAFGRMPTVKMVIATKDIGVIETAIRETANANRGEAMAEICRHYVETNGQLHSAAQGQPAAVGVG